MKSPFVMISGPTGKNGELVSSHGLVCILLTPHPSSKCIQEKNQRVLLVDNFMAFRSFLLLARLGPGLTHIHLVYVEPDLFQESIIQNRDSICYEQTRFHHVK